MNPLVQAFAGAAVRWLVTFAAARGLAVSDDAAHQVVYGAIAAAMLIWSWAHKANVDAKIKDAQAGL